MPTGILKRIVKKKKDKIFSKKQEVHGEFPADLPFNLRIGAIVKLDKTPFILMDGMLSFDHPGEKHVVEALSESKVFGLRIVRVYLDGADGHEDCVLQLHFSPEENELLDVLLLQELEEIFPEQLEDWDVWLDDEKGIIGQEELTHTYPVLTEGGEREETIIYNREWDSEVEGRVNPQTYKELIFNSPYDEPEVVQHESMLYARGFEDNDGTEFVLAEVLSSEDSANVLMSYGIMIEPGHIDVT